MFLENNNQMAVEPIDADRVPTAGSGAGEAVGLSLAQVLAILRAYWKVSCLIFVVAVLLSAGVAKIVPKTYKATATLMVSYEVNDPLAAKDVPMGLLANYIATQTELVQAPEILDAAIERLHLTSNPDYIAGNRGGDATLRDWVAGQLRKNLEVEGGHSGSQLISISAFARNPYLAADIANAIGDAFTERHFHEETGPANDRARRYGEELSDLQQKAATAQNALTQLRQRSGQIDFEGKTDVDANNLADLEHRLVDAQSALRAAQARAASDPSADRQFLATEPIRSLASEAATLKARMASLRTTFGPDYPQVVDLQSQIDANAKLIAELLHKQTAAALAEVQSAQQDVDVLQREIAAQRQAILNTRRARDEASKYQLELESAQSVYKRALDGYDQIMFASSGQNSNVKFASRARPAADSEKHRSLVILVMGALAGLGLGVAAPFAYEMLNRRIRVRDDVELDLRVPVLVEFMRLPIPGGVSAKG